MSPEASIVEKIKEEWVKEELWSSIDSSYLYQRITRQLVGYLHANLLTYQE